MHHPDDLDNRIAKELGNPLTLQWNVRESYASIARRIGVDEETVRKRIRWAEEVGSIMGWRVLVSPNLIGCVDAYVDLEVGDIERKQEILSQLRLLEGVINILNLEGRGLFVLLDSESGEALARKTRLIGSICGTDKLATWSGSIPPCDMRLSGTDWKIIWAIRDDPRKSLYRIAKEAGVTVRTVTRRLGLLTERRAIFLVGLPNFRKTPGVSANFLIYTPDRGRSSSVGEKIGSEFKTVVFGAPIAPDYLFYNIVFQNLTEADDAREWIKGLKGVANVRLGIMKDLIFVADWIDDQIRKRLPAA
jgi:DNA-binding Lrp family transcriptional regulator